MTSALVGACLAGFAVAVVASLVSRLGVERDLRTCLFAQLCGMIVRALGLILIAVIVRLLLPAHLLPAVGAACLVILGGLVLDVRSQLRMVRAASEDPARA